MREQKALIPPQGPTPAQGRPLPGELQAGSGCRSTNADTLWLCRRSARAADAEDEVALTEVNRQLKDSADFELERAILQEEVYGSRAELSCGRMPRRAVRT